MDSYIGTEEMWQRAERQVKAVIESKGVDYMDGLGESAFYGPKIDFMGRDSFGREFQAATIQLDFGQPEGFDLTCTNEAGEKEGIVMVHAAIMGSMERFMVLLIERYAGAFPVWLAPEQVRVAAVNGTEDLQAYGEKLVERFKAAGLRTSLDLSNESVGKKIRASELARVPYTIVIGEKEMASDELSPRVRKSYGENEPKPLKADAFINAVQREIAERSSQSLL
jgi:threonyl-tRNA synthetase